MAIQGPARDRVICPLESLRLWFYLTQWCMHRIGHGDQHADWVSFSSAQPKPAQNELFHSWSWLLACAVTSGWVGAAGAVRFLSLCTSDSFLAPRPGPHWCWRVSFPSTAAFCCKLIPRIIDYANIVSRQGKMSLINSRTRSLQKRFLSLFFFFVYF